MKAISLAHLCAPALICAITTPALAAPTASQICSKMIADGRGGGLSQNDCLCRYRVADAVLDADIKSLLFDAWHSGADNMQALEQLPRQNRVRKQLKTMQRALQANCT